MSHPDPVFFPRSRSFSIPGMAAIAAVFVAAGFGAAPAHAQGWVPTKPVEIVVGAGPGGGNDRIARNLQHIMQTKGLVPTPVVVMNKPGAGGTVGINYLNTHQGDGHYLMVQNPALVSNPLMGIGKATYKDISPVADLLADYVVLIGRSDSPYKDGKALLEALKANPKGLTVGVAPGIGTGVHMALAQVVQAAGIDPNQLHIIPFATASEAITGMLGGDIGIVPTTAQNAQELVKAGRVKVFGVTAPQRLPDAMASIPTWKEQGYDVVFNNWRAVVGPKGLPEAQQKYWDEVFRKLSESPEWATVAAQDVLVLDYRDSAALASFLEAQDGEAKALLTKLGLIKQ